MWGSRKSHLKILTSILSNISAGLLVLPLTISLSSGILHLDALTISFILAIIYYGFAVRIESFVEDI